MTCPRCQTELNPDARFCHRCGAPIAAAPAAPAPPPLPLPVSFVHGRYQVRQLLGEGGKKKVYLVHDTVLDREVAFSLIKTDGLDEVGIERVRREARLMGRLGGHPHIVAIHDLGEEDGQPYLVTELMAGGDLERLIARAPDRRPPLADSLRIADQVCQALAHAHEHGVVHRDLKPGNVWLTRDGMAKLGDFGLAMAIDRTRLSVAGLIVGTAGYMSPEQALGRTPDARSDLYALGAILYELTTGRPPFLGDDPVAVISQHINTAPVAPSWHNPTLPKPLEALILRLLAKDPAQRPEHAAAVRLALAALGGAPDQTGERREEAEANPLDRLAGGVFVGRESEVRQLRGALDAALGGRAGIVLLAGEPGIGKTTLAEETATYARLRGAQVLWGRCYEWEGAPAYWPWVQIIRGYVHARDPDQLRADLGTGAADVAQVVSEVRDRLPDLPELPRMEAEQARFRLFDGVATFLRNATTREPLLVVLDDLHWADAPSLLLLQFVARELDRARLLILGSYRDVEVGRRHPLTATLAELARAHRMQRIALQGLTAADIERLIALSAGIEPEAGLVEAVERETEGNPFFVGEVVRLMVAEGRLERARKSGSWSFGIPQSVRDVVGRRLDRLSPACNEVLAVASVVGREFTLPVLERASERDSATVLEALEEAVPARLVSEETPSGRYRFTHALVQETLYAELSATRRLRLHANVGQTLEQLHAANLAPRFGELAHHFAAAASAGHAAKAVDYAVKAGDRAMDQLAWEAAIQHYDRALQTMELLSAPDPARQCDVLLALGAAQYRTVLDVSEAPAGRQAFLSAAEIAKTIGSWERLARAALEFAGLNVVRTAGGLQQVQMLEAALALAPEGDDALKIRVMARLAVDYRVIPDVSDRVEQLSREAIAMARRLGDPSALAFSLIAGRTAIWGPDNLADRFAAVSEAKVAADASGELFLEMWTYPYRAIDLYELGDNQRLDRVIDEFVDEARRSSITYFLWASAIWQVNRAIREGRFAEVDMSLPWLGGDSRALVVVWFRALIPFLPRRWHGRLAELDEPLQAVVALTQDQISPFDRHRGHIARVLRMILLAETGFADEARAQFSAFVGQRLPDLPKDSYWLATIALLAEVCALVGDRERAALLSDLLGPYETRNVAPASSPAYFGAASYYLGLLDTLLMRWDDATRHFEAAIEMNAGMRAIPFLAQTRAAYARMLLARGAADDRTRAAELLAQAAATATELGMTRLADEIAALQEKAAASRRTAGGEAAARFGLSQRELEVLRLLAEGRSNPEIAEALYISRATARTHVDNILGKLGVHSRAEAVDAAHRAGLLADGHPRPA